MNILEKVQSIEKEYGSVLYCPNHDTRLKEMSDWWDEQTDITLEDETIIKIRLREHVPLWMISQELWIDSKELHDLAKQKGWI